MIAIIYLIFIIIIVAMCMVPGWKKRRQHSTVAKPDSTSVKQRQASARPARGDRRRYTAAGSRGRADTDGYGTCPADDPATVREGSAGRSRRARSAASSRSGQAPYQSAQASSRTLENEILARAKFNTQDQHDMDMHDDPTEREIYLRQELARERMDENSRSGAQAITESAKENALETQIDNAADSRYDLLRQVEDLIVLGPDYELPYERDFIAEGLDLLNGIRKEPREQRRIDDGDLIRQFQKGYRSDRQSG